MRTSRIRESDREFLMFNKNKNTWMWYDSIMVGGGGGQSVQRDCYIVICYKKGNF